MNKRIMFSLTLLLFASLLPISFGEFVDNPREQLESGIAPEDVTCIEGLSLVIKTTNNLPACVKHSSIEILIQRDWAVTPIEHYADFAKAPIENDSMADKQKIAQKAQSIWDYSLQQQEDEFEGEYIEGPT